MCILWRDLGSSMAEADTQCFLESRAGQLSDNAGCGIAPAWKGCEDALNKLSTGMPRIQEENFRLEEEYRELQVSIKSKQDQPEDRQRRRELESLKETVPTERRRTKTNRGHVAAAFPSSRHVRELSESTGTSSLQLFRSCRSEWRTPDFETCVRF